MPSEYDPSPQDDWLVYPPRPLLVPVFISVETPYGEVSVELHLEKKINQRSHQQQWNRTSAIGGRVYRNERIV
jgi:hypothetical protein